MILLSIAASTLALATQRPWAIAFSALNLGMVVGDRKSRTGLRQLVAPGLPPKAASPGIQTTSSKHSFRGRLIVVEGIRGAGKTTLVRRSQSPVLAFPSLTRTPLDQQTGRIL